MNMLKCDVVVVGAGLSGLVSAHDIRHFDPTLNVIVLEASDRIGGRLDTLKLKLNDSQQVLNLNMGGQFIQGDQKNVFQLLDQLGVQTYRVMQPNATLRPLVRSDEKWFMLANLEFKYMLRKLDKLTKKIDSRFPYKNKRLAQQMDAITVESFLTSKCYFSMTKEMFDFKFKIYFGRTSQSVSMLTLLVFAASMGGMARMFDDQTHEVFCVQGGSEIMCQKLAQNVGTNNVILNQPVTSITTSPDGKVLVTTGTAQTYQCDHVICSVPLNLVHKIEFHPLLPQKLRFTLSSYSAGEISKFYLIYKSRFWHQKNHSGLMINLGKNKKLSEDMGSFFVAILDCSSDSDTNGVMVGFLVHDESLESSEVSDDDLGLQIMERIAEWADDQRYLEAQKFVIKRWSDEPFIGAPSVTSRPGSMDFTDMLRDTHGKITFAGAETASRWVGFMSGAIEAGQRTAIQTLEELRPQVISAQDYANLKESRISLKEREILAQKNKEIEKSDGGKFSILRYTLFLPIVGLALGYAALACRDKYGKLLFPMPG